jgi:cyclase
MMLPRVIPVLLLKGNGVYKTEKFKNPKYIGDPINAVKIFNEKEVDEIIILDIDATANKQINYKLIEDLAGECFMPMSYGGGITSIEEIKKIISIGVEKVSINSAALNNLEIIKNASLQFGSSTIIVSVDIKKNLFGKYEIYNANKIKIKDNLIDYCKKIEAYGAGEILINNVDKDGTMTGYDFNILKTITENVNIPVIACGGAGKLEDFKHAIEYSKCSAVAAGSMFVFHGKHRAVLINYPSQNELKNLFEH